MTKRLLIVACAFMLGGCALPIPVQIASWAIDGILLVTTEKTVADHGISLVADRDCAMLRAVTGGAVCRDGNGQTAVAVLDLPPPGNADAESTVTLVDADNVAEGVAAIDSTTQAVTEIAAFETAAGTFAGSLEKAPFEEPALSEARWEAIIGAPSFLDGSTEPTDIEPKRQSIPEQMAEPAFERPATPEPELATTAPSGNDAFNFLFDDYPLNFGDIFEELHTFVMADVSPWGRADGNILYGSAGGAGDTHDPMPVVPPLAGLSGPYRHARRRRPAKRSMDSSGRGPPPNPRRKSRLIRSRGFG